MKIIALFMPAFISVNIKRARRKDSSKKAVERLIEYGLYVLINVLLTIGVVTYGLGIYGVEEEAFGSFSFFIKYTLIAVIMAVIVPYIEEIIKKYIKVTFEVKSYDEEN